MLPVTSTTVRGSMATSGCPNGSRPIRCSVSSVWTIQIPSDSCRPSSTISYRSGLSPTGRKYRPYDISESLECSLVSKSIRSSCSPASWREMYSEAISLSVLANSVGDKLVDPVRLEVRRCSKRSRPTLSSSSFSMSRASIRLTAIVKIRGFLSALKTDLSNRSGSFVRVRRMASSSGLVHSGTTIRIMASAVACLMAGRWFRAYPLYAYTH